MDQTYSQICWKQNDEKEGKQASSHHVTDVDKVLYFFLPGRKFNEFHEYF